MRSEKVGRILLIVTCWLVAAALPSDVQATEMTCTTVATYPDTLAALGFTSDYSGAVCAVEMELQIHVLRQTGGTGGLQAAAVDSIIQGLTSVYSSVGFAFRFAEVQYSDDSNWYADPIGSAAAIFAALDSTGAVHLVLGPAIGSLQCKAESIPGTIAIVTGPVEGTPAASHALAHCLGLFDTDESAAFGAEAVDGSNSASAGDRIVSTAADPGLSGYVDQYGDLTTQFFIDYPGYSPDPTNSMCAGPVDFWTGFTVEQGARMRATAESFEDIAETILALSTLYYDKTSQTGMANQYTGQAESGTAIDYNRDGLVDMIVVRADMTAWRTTQHTLDGVPQFEDRTAEDFDDDTGPNVAGDRAAIAIDFDNDGWMDLYVPNDNYPNSSGHRLYRNVAGKYFDVTIATGMSAIGRPWSNGAGWADYDQDGFVDVLLRRTNPVSTSTSWALLHNEPAPSDTTQRIFVDATVQTGLTVNTYDDGCVWADFDADGDLDVLFVQTRDNGSNRESIFLVNEGGQFQDATSTNLIGADLFRAYPRASAVDVDNDGDLDVAYSGYMDSGYFLNTAGVLQLAWHGRPTGFIENPYDFDVLDFELDGRMDITTDWGTVSSFPLLLRNSYDDALGTAVFRPVTNNAGISLAKPTRKSCIADFNRDGFKDVYLGRTSNEVFFYKANTAPGWTPNHWIAFELICPTKANNTAAIGATVTIQYADGQSQAVTQAQIIDGGTGRGVQQSQELVFGLGSSNGPVFATVRWPDGTTELYPWLATNRYYRLADGAQPIKSGSPHAAVEYLGGFPDPITVNWVFTWETEVEPGDKALDQVELDISGLSGTCVPSRTLLQYGDSDVVVDDPALTAMGTYLHKLTWVDTDCLAGCTIPYTVTSGLVSNTYEFTGTSNPHNLRIRTCLSQ